MYTEQGAAPKIHSKFVDISKFSRAFLIVHRKQVKLHAEPLNW